MDDRKEVIEAALAENDLVLAVQLLQSLGESTGNDPELARLRLLAHFTMGQWERARALAREHFAGPDGGAFKLLLARGLGRSGREHYRSEVTGLVSELVRHPERSVAREAVEALLELPRDWVDAPLRAEARARLEGQSDRTRAEELALAALLLRDPRESRERLVEQVVGAHRDDIPALVAWLVRAEAWEEIAALTEEGELDESTFNHRMTALHGLERYDDLDAELKDPPVPVHDALRHGARAALAIKRDQRAEAVSLWQQAFKAAELDRSDNQYYRLAVMARQVNDTERQMEALARAIEHPRGIPPAADQLVPLFKWLHASAKGKRFLGITFRLLQREPGNPVLINNYHYLRAMHDDPSVNSVDALQVLVNSFPEETTVPQHAGPGPRSHGQGE